MLSSSKAPECSKFSKNQWNFLWHQARVECKSLNKFTNWGSFAKVFVPVETIIPCFDEPNIRSCLTPSIESTTLNRLTQSSKLLNRSSSMSMKCWLADFKNCGHSFYNTSAWLAEFNIFKSAYHSSFKNSLNF